MRDFPERFEACMWLSGEVADLLDLAISPAGRYAHPFTFIETNVLL